MNIHYRILKNRHGTYAQASKLETYIRNADVVSLEWSGPRESEVRKDEVNYRNNYYSLSVAERRGFEEDFARTSQRIGHPVTKEDYWFKAFSVAVKHNKPLIYAERHTPIDARVLEYMDKKRRGYLKESVWWSMRGDLGKAVDSLLQSGNLNDKRAKFRDNRIVKTASQIEGRIIEIYPELKDKDPLVYLIVMGFAHRIEDGLRDLGKSVEPVPLKFDMSESDWVESVYLGINLNEASDTIRQNAARGILANMLEFLVKNQLRGQQDENKAIKSYSQLAVAGMGLEEAEALFSRLQPHCTPNLRSMLFGPRYVKVDFKDYMRTVQDFFVRANVLIPSSTQEMGNLFKRIRNS